ncbi:MAG: hypothetical protein KKB37_14425 [Alphaproteobacteria bacterium]|nr:hypothetical protein [Alphaproteobacteria bacterium]
MQWRTVISLASAIVAFASAAQPAMARLSCNEAPRAATRVRAESTDVRPQIRLDRIGSSELIGNNRTERRYRHRGDLVAPPFEVRRIVRQIPDLWRRRIPAGISPSALRVEHQLVMSGSRTNAAVQTDNIDSQLPVVIRPTPPVVLCKQGDYQIVEGGVLLEFPLSGLPSSGRYQVEIETRVELP